MDKQNRTALMHVRMKPELRAEIDREASELKIAPSALVRRVMAERYTK